MLRTFVVRLASKDSPRFPKRCVSCGDAEPGSFIPASDRASGLASFFMPILMFFGRKAKTRAPACLTCRRADTWQKWSRFGLAVAGVFVLFATLDPLLESYGFSKRAKRGLILLGIVVLFIPAYLWTKLYPRAFTIEAEKNATEYHFASAEYAEDFAAMNGSSVEDD